MTVAPYRKDHAQFKVDKTKKSQTHLMCICAAARPYRDARAGVNQSHL